MTLNQYFVWEWTVSQPWRWDKTYGERKLQHNGNDGRAPYHPGLWAHPNRNAKLSRFGQCFDSWNLRGCWRKWWWQRCRWHALFSSHHWVSNLRDGSQQDFLEEFWAWCETAVLRIRAYLKTTMDFVWKVELVTLGYWSHFSISLSYIISQNYSNICFSLGQENKTSNVMPGCWSTEKSSNPTETDFHSKSCH